MALTTGQQPERLNYSMNELVFTATSDQVNQPSFSYVITIGSLQGATIPQLRKQANPNGDLVVDLQRVLNDALEYETAALGSTSTSRIPAVEGWDRFTVSVAEEYLIDSVLTTQVGVPFLSIVVIKGIQEFNTGTLTGEVIPDRATLSRWPLTSRIHRDDFLMVTFEDVDGGVSNRVVNTPATGSTYTQGLNGLTYTFDIYDERSFLGEVRFCWINRRGGWEFFTATEEETINVSAETQSYERPVIDFVGAVSSNRLAGNDMVFNSSSIAYNGTFNETRTKNTQYLETEEEVSRVASLFTSPLVYIQEGDTFIPVEITNGYEVQTQLRQQQNFSYPIAYRLRNNIRGY